MAEEPPSRTVLANREWYQKASREWTPRERTINSFVLSFAASTYWIGVLAVYFSKYVIDCCERVAIIYLWNPWFKSQDGKVIGEGVKLPPKRFKYGSHGREYGYHLEPSTQPEERKTLLYLHGGGFVAANAGVLMQSVTSFIRQGFDVYCINYRREPFPTGMVSALKALRWLKEEQGITHVGVVGDSAGGNLALQSTACVCNLALLEEIRKLSEVPEDALPLDSTAYPEVDAVSSICGLLDRNTFTQARLDTIYYVENLFMLLFCSFATWMYEYRIPDEASHWGVDLPYLKVKTMPPIFLAAGEQDPLVSTSFHAYNMLRSICGLDVSIATYPGRHIFFGFPTWWTGGNWKISAQPCLNDLSRFFHEHLTPNKKHDESSAGESSVGYWRKVLDSMGGPCARATSVPLIVKRVFGRRDSGASVEGL